MLDLSDGRLWVLLALFEIAEDNDVMVDELLFVPTDGGQRLMFERNGKTVGINFQFSELEGCVAGGAARDQVSANREVIKRRLRTILSNIRELERKDEITLTRRRQHALE